MATDSEVLALGFDLPAGSDSIRDGDDAIRNNARAVVDLFHAIVADPDLASVLDVAVGRTSRAQHAPALGLYFPEAEGAIGDGVTNDTAAFQAAIDAAAAAGGGRVVVAYKATGYLVGPLSVAANVVVAGDQLVSLHKSGTAGNWLTLLTGAALEGLTVDCTGADTVNLVYTGSPRARVERCQLVGAGNGVRLVDGAIDVLIDRNLFTGNTHGVHAGTANTTRIRVTNNRFTGWTQRAVYVTGTATQRSDGFRVEGNHISGCVGTAADPRQPICFEGNDALQHLRVRVVGNTIVGNDTSYDDPTTPGTADQISLHRCYDFVVANNTSTGGGDVGITVSMQCKNGVVVGNLCTRNDSVGICIGSATTTTTAAVTVTGNTCTDNFQNRLVDGPVRTAAGILLNKAQNCTVAGNELGDTQGSATQQYAVSIVDSTGCTVGANGFDYSEGYYVEGVNSGIRWAVPARRAVKAADETVNNSAALQDDDHLTFPVVAGAVYQLEGLLAYSSSTVADLAVALGLPAGADALWVADGPASTTTSPNTSVSRSRLLGASTAALGGTGGNAVALIRGTVTIGATAGTLKLRWAQNTAEATATVMLAGSYLTLTRIG